MRRFPGMENPLSDGAVEEVQRLPGILQDILILYGFSSLSFFASPVIAGAVNISIITILPIVTLTEGGSIIGGMTEPFTTKLLPAIFVAYVFMNVRNSGISLEVHALPLAILGGIMMNLGEVYWIKIPQHASNTPPQIIISAMFATMFLHVVGAILVAGTYFRTVEEDVSIRRALIRTLPWILIAMAFHVSWNGWFSKQDWFIQFWFS